MSDWPAALLIRAKREGRSLDASQWKALADGIASNGWSEGQVGAMAMAIAWRGLGTQECRDFTYALRDSGRCLDWRDLPGPVLDKHSTGGVGDCVSLALAPLVAACGGYVPMISGRGLGYIGGTLDKLESVFGVDVQLDPARLQRLVREVGVEHVPAIVQGIERELAAHAAADGQVSLGGSTSVASALRP